MCTPLHNFRERFFATLRFHLFCLIVSIYSQLPSRACNPISSQFSCWQRCAESFGNKPLSWALLTSAPTLLPCCCCCCTYLLCHAVSCLLHKLLQCVCVLLGFAYCLLLVFVSFYFFFQKFFSQIFFLKVEIWRFHLVAAGVGASFDVVVIIAADIQLHSCAHHFVVIVVVWWHCCHSHLLYCVLCSCFASFSCSSKDALCVWMCVCVWGGVSVAVAVALCQLCAWCLFVISVGLIEVLPLRSKADLSRRQMHGLVRNEALACYTHTYTCRHIQVWVQNV